MTRSTQGKEPPPDPGRLTYLVPDTCRRLKSSASSAKGLWIFTGAPSEDFLTGVMCLTRISG